MATAEITPRAYFGLRTDIKQNAHYISDFQILYPAGAVLILHNYYEKRQRFIKLFDKSLFLEMVVISPSRKLAAIIQNGDKGQILVFDIQTLKRRRTLNLPPDATTNRFETISFSHDDIYIMAITGEPDWNLVTYRWEKGKVTSNVKALYSNNIGSVIQVCCSPTNSAEVCLIGPSLFRLLTMSETVWRQYGFQKADQINVTSAAWVSGERLVCGTGDGKLFFVENGDLKGVYNALGSYMINVKEKDDTSTIASSSLLMVKPTYEASDSEDLAVRALISFPKGFAFSCKIGCVHLFEKESNTKFKKRNLFKICDTNLGNLQQVELNVVNHLSINISQDKLLATTNRAQIYTVRLWGPDINVAPEIPFKLLGEPLHHGPITELSMSLWKPIFATCGALDQTVRIWNYETETIEMVKAYQEPVYCIDLHATGNFIAITFTERLDLSVILMNDIQSIRSLPIKECKKCKYSMHGNYLAAVNQNNIEVIGVILFQHLHVLKGHTGKINSLCWILEDRKIVSCGSEGEIFTWDTVNGVLLVEFQTPGISYWDIAVTSDGKFIFAVGSDGLLKEISETTVVRTVKINQNNLDNIFLSRSNLMMFLTADTHAVFSFKMPLTTPPEYSSFHYHCTKINRIKLSCDDQTLITVSEGGAVIIWKLNFTEGKTIAMDKTFLHSTEIMIDKDELEKKMLAIKDLSQTLYELEMDQAREMRDTEASFLDKIKEIHETFTAAIEELREKIEQTEADQKAQLENIKEEVNELRKKQEKEKEDMIENYKSKLLVEYEKVRALDVLKDTTINDFENRVAELEKSKEEETNEIIRLYKEKLEDVDNLLKTTFEENSKNIAEHETIKRQVEDDADREIVETKAKYEGILKEERERNLVFKEEAFNMRKKHAEAQKERDEYRAKVEMLKGVQQKYQSNIQALEKDIADLKAEIMERDMAIEDKDERIFLLKKRIQELDKFKFVLDYKIKELRKQIDPKDREIRERNEQIADMEVELDNLRKMNSSLEIQLTELKEKINGTEREISNIETKHQCCVRTLRQIKVDVYSLYQELNDFKKLREGIKVLYHKYYLIEIPEKAAYGESDLQRELMAQRECLEKTIVALKSTLSKNQHSKSIGTKVVRDNVLLLEEVNAIRKDLKQATTTVKNLEKLVGIKGKKPVVPSEAFNRLEQTLKKQENIKQMYQEVIDEANQETEALNEKVKHMHEKLCTLLKSREEQ